MTKDEIHARIAEASAELEALKASNTNADMTVEAERYYRQRTDELTREIAGLRAQLEEG